MTFVISYYSYILRHYFIIW